MTLLLQPSFEPSNILSLLFSVGTSCLSGEGITVTIIGVGTATYLGIDGSEDREVETNIPCSVGDLIG